MTTGPKDVSLAITEMLEDAIALIEGYIDINSNGGPNDAMRASQLVKDVLRLEKERYWRQLREDSRA